MGGHDGDGLDKELSVNNWAQFLTLGCSFDIFS